MEILSCQIYLNCFKDFPNIFRRHDVFHYTMVSFSTRDKRLRISCNNKTVCYDTFGNIAAVFALLTMERSTDYKDCRKVVTGKLKTYKIILFYIKFNKRVNVIWKMGLWRRYPRIPSIHDFGSKYLGLFQ